MSLEATMIVLDNSAYAINGDYSPTRWGAQTDAVHVVFNRKVNANPESVVGLMVMAGKSPEVLVTPTQDEGQIIAALHETKQGGEADLATGINVAQLALKHRQNKNQRQRIIVFVGSPISTSSANLVKLGKKMKKNNVAIDIVAFGSADDEPLSAPSTSGGEGAAPETNERKLLALHEAVNSSDNSHLLSVEPGPHLLSDRIVSSAILRGEGQAEGGGGGGEEDEYGVDPNLDPELAMALRMSMQEERARQEAAQAAASGASAAPALETVSEAATTDAAVPAPTSTAETPATTAPAPPQTPANPPPAAAAPADVAMAVEDDDEEAALAAALAMSRGDEGGDEAMEEDEDADIARAIALSMQENQGEEEKK